MMKKFMIPMIYTLVAIFGIIANQPYLLIGGIFGLILYLIGTFANNYFSDFHHKTFRLDIAFIALLVNVYAIAIAASFSNMDLQNSIWFDYFLMILFLIPCNLVFFMMGSSMRLKRRAIKKVDPYLKKIGM